MKQVIGVIVGIALIAGGGLAGLIWTTCRVYVPENKCAVLIRKSGTPLQKGQTIATEKGQKGIQEQVLGPGRHWYDPIRWEYRLVDLVVIPAGNPRTWDWTSSTSRDQTEQPRQKVFRLQGDFPMIGVVTRKVGTATNETIVDRASGKRGILREVLTPGTYKINPEVYEVELYPATVIPAGFVGVVTNMFGVSPTGASVRDLNEPEVGLPPAEGAPATDQFERKAPLLAEPGERGTLVDVLQPGVYFINPKLQRITLVEIGFHEYSQVKQSDGANFRISFPSDTGFTIGVGVTVIWGIHPRRAAQTINEFGNVDSVLDKVIGPQLRSICRNIGSTYAARDFIQGEKREMFQRDLTAELQRVCREKHVEVLLALVREIEVTAPDATPGEGDVTADLKRTIQQSYIAIEKQITNEKQREAAAVRAKLEEEQKKIEIVREEIQAETRLLVEGISAEAEKEAAEIDARAQLEVAGIMQQVAELDAQRVRILGQASADVEKMKNSAEAEGYRMLVEAFGSPEAYNLYTFAENFQPESIRLFYAGEGTFWTDLTRLEEASAAKILHSSGGGG